MWSWSEGEGGGFGSAGEGDLELAEADEGVADVAHDLEAHLAPGRGDLVEGHPVPGQGEGEG